MNLDMVYEETQPYWACTVCGNLLRFYTRRAPDCLGAEYEGGVRMVPIRYRAFENLSGRTVHV